MPNNQTIREGIKMGRVSLNPITLDWINAELEEAEQIQAKFEAECIATDWAELDIEIDYREQCGWVSAMKYIKQQMTAQ
jgi:hypothetical protein